MKRDTHKTRVHLGLAVVGPHHGGDHDDHEDEVAHENQVVVVLLHQESREPDGHFKALLAVWIAELLPVSTCFFVRQRLCGMVKLYNREIEKSATQQQKCLVSLRAFFFQIIKRKKKKKKQATLEMVSHRRPLRPS